MPRTTTGQPRRPEPFPPGSIRLRPWAEAIRMATALDTTQDCSLRAAELRTAGYQTIIRYYSMSAWKRIGAAEARALTRAGLRLAVTYQDRQNQVADFSEPKGRLAGQNAFNYAQSVIMQPADFERSTLRWTSTPPNRRSPIASSRSSTECAPQCSPRTTTRCPTGSAYMVPGGRVARFWPRTWSNSPGCRNRPGSRSTRRSWPRGIGT